VFTLIHFLLHPFFHGLLNDFEESDANQNQDDDGRKELYLFNLEMRHYAQYQPQRCSTEQIPILLNHYPS
jgi:hypothetical protein